ncbi:MBL fold metallo-hydrolase [Engelhardtia mirabilis]|uniref:Beta-lactamase hydrolase-like protein n=1 Tax=Engelhardtia mirabilis TaxID=2528011 RepID=A0A518BRX0_9BACT|nr:Beta-lactamase hydrolase-like protein [Planctomycetes bacterium Pla133]QDV04045.1 Beta-lactamase hydrolase-like protein [Planctomycetes bacterium Pla86]
MILERHYLGCLSQASYLIVDELTKTAAVVDPRRDVELYLEAAARHGATIRHVFLTHFHADFVAGHLELARRTGATLYLGRRATADYEFRPMGDGDRVEFGQVSIEALETPGHTPESVTWLVRDLAPDAAVPLYALTGDTLFIGDVGRPDLMASVGVTAQELASEMYDSLHDKLLALPDDTVVYPGHGAGSACGKSLSDAERSTIGEQRATNPALRPLGKEEFVAELTTGQPAAPAYFAHDATLNRGQVEGLDRLVGDGPPAMTLDQVLAAQAEGAQVLDVRGAEAFAAGHLAGSDAIGLEGRFASWAGSLLDLERPIVVVTKPGTEREVAVRLARVGLDRVLGYLDGAEQAFAARPDLVRSFPRVEASALPTLLSGTGAPLPVDIRAPGEWADGHLDGAVHVPLVELAGRTAELPRDRPLLLICRSGYRSSPAAAILEREGFGPVMELRGGMLAVESAGSAKG